MCDNGDAQLVRTRGRFQVLSDESEDDDEDVLVPRDAQPTQVDDDAVNGIGSEDFDLTVGDPEEVQPATTPNRKKIGVGPPGLVQHATFNARQILPVASRSCRGFGASICIGFWSTLQ